MNTIDELKRQLLSLGMLYRNNYAEWPDFVILGKKERGIVEKYKLSSMSPSELAKGNLDGPKEILGFKIVDSAEHEYFAVSHCLLNEERYQAIKAQESAGNDLFEGENQVKFLGLPLVKLSTIQGPRYGVVLHNTDRNPTIDAYSEINQAFDHFNKMLFEGELPKCLITMQRDKRCYGFLSKGQFVNKDGASIDELALNPSYFGVRSIADTLSELVHTMCHLWQAHFGNPSRAGYHNGEWADKMKEVGLMASDTGLPNGKRVGQRMSHYIISNGPFEVACSGLLSNEFALSWYDRFPPVSEDEVTLRQEVKNTNLSISPALRPMETGIDKSFLTFEETYSDHDGDDEEKRVKPVGRSNRYKYQCPKCKTQVWGKPDIRLCCGNEDCEKVDFEVTDE